MDQPWYPPVFRHIQADYLEFVATRGAGHQNLVPLFAKVLRLTGIDEILDLCSGGAGPWKRLRTQLEQTGLPVKVTLTDKYPTAELIKKWTASPHEGITYLPEPVDALAVPSHLKGMRTMFEGFHHFKPESARQILQDAADSQVPIGIFEASLTLPQGPLVFLLSPLMTLLGYFFATPWILPRTWSRFIWTYLLPVVPLATIWDCLVSFLRVYSPPQLREMTRPLQREEYRWEIGQASTGTPLFVFTYLIGYPCKPHMPSQDVVDLVTLFERNGIELLLDGGWGVDALLGEQTREHSDLDVAMPHRYVPRARSLLEDRGYTEMLRPDTRDCNFVMGDAAGHLIDFHTYTFDEQGNLVFGLAYPPESLQGTGSVLGRPVRCITPEWLVRFHTGYEFDENDYRDVSALCQHFQLEMPEEYLHAAQKMTHGD
jgi:lincosamide nucleotidyltransferase A/C/D/E